MGEDISKNAKIKLSLNDFPLKQPMSIIDSVEYAETLSPKTTTNLKLKRDLDNIESFTDQEEKSTKHLPNIDFDSQSSEIKSSISDTVKLKVIPKKEILVKPVVRIAKEPMMQENPSSVLHDTSSPDPKIVTKKSNFDGDVQIEDKFSIPSNLSYGSAYSRKIKEKSNMVIVGIFLVVFIAVVYFMVKTIKTLTL